jgi:hypothetical protein
MSFRMNRKTIVTGIFVLALLAMVIARSGNVEWPLWFRRSFSTKSERPEDAVYAMLDAARAGDTKTYLDFFSSPVRDQLQQVIRENSEPKFAEYLKAQNTAFQSVAVSLADRASESEVTARVEYVYANRNEVQSLSLRKEDSRWRIFKIAGADQIKTLVPFGSAVTD